MADSTKPVAHRRSVNTQAAAEHLGCSPRQLRRLAQEEPTFPKPWDIAGPTATTPTLRWDLDELDEWIASKRVTDNSRAVKSTVLVDGTNMPEFLMTPTMRRSAGLPRQKKGRR
jgi:hypothetical protein